MSDYQCPVCGTHNPKGWRSCWYAGCPDGRDKGKWIEETMAEQKAGLERQEKAKGLLR